MKQVVNYKKHKRVNSLLFYIMATLFVDDLLQAASSRLATRQVQESQHIWRVFLQRCSPNISVKGLNFLMWVEEIK